MLNFLTLFSGPIGAFINKTLAMASAGFVSWEVAQGVPMTSATSISASLVAAASTAISVFAARQGVHINAVNVAQNGVKVVSAQSTSPQVNTPLSPFHS